MIFPLLDSPLINTLTNRPAQIRLRPLIPLRVAGPNGRLIFIDGLVDTGSDEVLLPDNLLPRLGFPPGSGVTRSTSGIGGSRQTVYHPVRLEIRVAANDRVAWNATVGFTQLPYHVALFGIAGGLEFFHTSLNLINRQFVLFPHPSLPLASACVVPHAAFTVP